MFFGFYTDDHAFIAESAHGGFSAVPGASCGYGLDTAHGHLNEFDWENTHNDGLNFGDMAHSGGNADVAVDPLVGTEIKLVRESDGSVRLYTGGEVVTADHSELLRNQGKAKM